MTEKLEHLKGCKREHAESDICRNWQGRPLIVLPDGKVTSYSRASSYGEALDDKGGLFDWSAACAIRGVMRRNELLTAFASVDDGWKTKESKDKVRPILKEASVAGGSEEKSTIGTALHTFTERLDLGQPVGFVPPEYEADLMAYEYATEDLDHFAVEQFLVQDDLRVGGTADRFSNFPVADPDGVVAPRVVDLKSGNVKYPGKMAVQLGIYANSTPYDIATRTRLEPLGVNKKWGVIIHLPAGSGQATLWWLDLERGWRGANLARQVYDWRKEKNLLVPLDGFPF